MNRGIGRVFLIISAAVLPARADHYPRQSGVDVQHYIFRVTLSDRSDEISGQTTIEVRFLRGGIRSLGLDLASPANGKGMTVTRVTESGAPLAFTHAANRLSLTLPSPAHAESLHRYTIEYHGIPADGLHIGPNQFGARTFFSNNWPDLARQWLPTVDHPYDKASSEFLVTAPAQYQVVSNGVLAEDLDLPGGLRQTHWIQREPIATWLNNIGVARFSSRTFGSAAGAPLETWFFPQDRDAAIHRFEEPMRQSIEFFTDRIGPYPYDKLASVEATSFSGGMENASAIFYGERSVTGRPAFGLVAHETAHQWFGDSVTEKDWDDVWLSEGFATYFALLAVEHYAGRDAFIQELQNRRNLVFQAEKKLPAVAVVQTRPWNGIPNAIVYQKGAWVLHLLRCQLGSEAFWKGIREYYRRHRDSNASTADFERAMEQASGSDLRWFFRQWVYRPGSPVLDGSWKFEASSKKIEIELSQRQPGDSYRLPLQIGVFFASDSKKKIENIEMNQKQQNFTFSSDTEPATVVLDPNTRMLFQGHFVKR